MGEPEHQSAIRKREDHNRGSGCVIRCITKYDNHPHSHRYNAAKQARAEKDVYTMPLQKAARYTWPLEKWLEKIAKGLLVGRLTQDGSGKATGGLKPWKDAMSPFPHNAHHLIPMGVLWTDVVENVKDRAKGAYQAAMFELVVGGMLKEKYNHNARVNMVVLPTRNQESRALGLPRHLQTKSHQAHPVYQKAISSQVQAKAPPEYDGLVADLNNKGHKAQLDPIKIGPTLRPISIATYDTIMAIARAQRGAGQSLDDMAEEIGQSVSAALAG